MVDDRLHPQDVGGVIQLERIALELVLDPTPDGPAFQAGGRVALESVVGFAAQEAEDIVGLQDRQTALDQGRVEGHQASPVVEQDISGVE